MDPFSTEFELMCYVKDTKVLNGKCTYEEIVDKFGCNIVKEVMVEKNYIGYSELNKDSLDWTDIGWDNMKI